jgi:hypothetical protein
MFSIFLSEAQAQKDLSLEKKKVILNFKLFYYYKMHLSLLNYSVSETY